MSLVTFILGAAVGGGGAFYYLKSKSAADLADRDREISRLKSELAAARQAPAAISVGDSRKSEPKARAEARPAASGAKPQAAANENQTKFDDLTRIKGIGPALADKLNDIGITRFEQIAAFSSADIDRIKQQISSRGLRNPNDWIHQARVLMKDDQGKA